MNHVLAEDSRDSISYLRDLEFDCKYGGNIAPSKLADTCRSLYLHIKENLETEMKDDECTAMMSECYLKGYEGVVDRMDDMGMNNFAPGALALCNFHKNESAKWTTSLSVDKILGMSENEDSDTSSEEEADTVIVLRDKNNKYDPFIPDNGVPTSPKSLLKQGTRQTQQTRGRPSHHLSSLAPTSAVVNPSTASVPMQATIEGFSSREPDKTSSGMSTGQYEQVPGQPLFQNGQTSSLPGRQRSDSSDSHCIAACKPQSSNFTFHQSNNIGRIANFAGSLSNFHGSDSNFVGPDSNYAGQNQNFGSEHGNFSCQNSSMVSQPSLFGGQHSNGPAHHPLYQNRQSAATGNQRSVAYEQTSHETRFNLGPPVPHTTASSLPGHNASRRVHNNHGQFARNPEIQHRDRLEVNPEKVGGPYSNFGQKRKNPSSASQWASKSSRPWSNQSKDEDSDDSDGRPVPFRTAHEQYLINQSNKPGASLDRSSVSGANYGTGKKSLGTRRGPTGKFVPPILNRESDEDHQGRQPSRPGTGDPEEPQDERLKGIDPKMIELINNEIMDQSACITWQDIAGLDFAKKTIKEIVVWPMLRPDIFTGLRGPPKGLLLFGPPGTGKTLIGKCIASQSKSTFFCISASSLTSKWVGDGEKMVRALFAVARVHQPSVVFIDEIDSLLSQRSDSEHESSRRIKTEFLVQLDGAATGSEDRILVIGATNRPQEIDEAARRRFVKRLLIPLPEAVARQQIVINLMSQQRADLSQDDVNLICEKTDGYSGADMTNLCREAALGPIRSIPFEAMETVTAEEVRPIILSDFDAALHQVRASVSNKDLQLYTDWNQTYGSFAQ